MNKLKAYLIDRAKLLVNDFGVCALKLGTEAEANTFEEIKIYNDMFSDIMDIVVKIGGCDARNDIKKMAEFGIKGLIAPMLESSYALFNFIRALREEIGNNFLEVFPFLSINIETKTGYVNLDEIFSSDYIGYITQITIGRTDLFSSYNCSIDSPILEGIVKDIRERSKRIGKIVSIGGQITPKRSRRIVEYIKPEKINIRNVVIMTERTKDIERSVKEALLFEGELLRFSLENRLNVSSLLRHRIDIIRGRLMQ